MILPLSHSKSSKKTAARNEGGFERSSEGLDPRETVFANCRLYDSFFPGCRGQNADYNFCYLRRASLSAPIHLTKYECVSATESEGMMKKDNFNDDFGNMIDQNLLLPGIRDAYSNGGKGEWIMKVGNEFLRDGLKHLNKRQISIIEALFFEGKCLEDICIQYGLSYDEALEEIGRMKITLVKYL